MPSDTIFFSYSRDDSEFVLNLAKNLRQSGANIWLDQLDIKPGTRWDKSIETALENSNTLLVILTKKSVESTNVMDEVSFALEENKTVVPVLLEECDIPFRLRRLQFADFSKDQNKGLKTLAEALHLTGSVATKLTDSTIIPISDTGQISQPNNGRNEEIVVKRVEKEKQTIHSDANNQSQVTPIQSNSSKNRAIILSVSGVLILGIFAFFMKEKIFSNKDLIAWELALDKDSIEEYKFYLRTNPTGLYQLAARDSIDSIEKKEKVLADSKAWNKADSINTVVALERYLKEFNQGKFVAKAKEKIKILIESGEKIAEDNEAWDRVKKSSLVDDLASYVINESILGQHKSEALAMINEVGNEGWLFCGRIVGEKISDSVLELIWRDRSDFSNNMIPAIGDILVVKKAFRTHRRVGATEAEDPTGRFVEIDKKVLLLGTELRNNALFAKVRYD
jgi:hypothetical protein